MEEITKVVFRKFKDGEKEVIAILFSVSDVNPGNYMSYMHVGQHGETTQDITSFTKLATKEEYSDLKKELETHFGYKLKVYRKIQRR